VIRDKELMRAVSRILQRSERQQDPNKIINTFVDIGILPQLENLNNQIIYGRRGTGKTHILKYLASQLREQGNVVIYIDARTLGSISQFSDPDVPFEIRCIALFRDILDEIYNGLLECIVENSTNQADTALDNLDKLSRVAIEPIKKYTEEIVQTRTVNIGNKGKSIAGNVNTSENFGLEFEYKNNISSESEKVSFYRVSQEDKVIFPELYSLLNEVLEKTQVTLYIFGDENPISDSLRYRVLSEAKGRCALCGATKAV